MFLFFPQYSTRPLSLQNPHFPQTDTIYGPSTCVSKQVTQSVYKNAHAYIFMPLPHGDLTRMSWGDPVVDVRNTRAKKKI